jgi:YD repeat-containing protein
MYNTRVWIVVALAVGLAGYSKDGTAQETSAHECPENAHGPAGGVAVQCDSNGNTLTEEIDRGADGTVDSRRTYTYDAAGNMLTREADNDADGTVDRRWTYTYDADGNRLTQEVDWDADGTVDRRWTYTYDAAGNRLTAELDEGADGTVDRRCTYNPPCPPEVNRDLDQSCPGLTCVDL